MHFCKTHFCNEIEPYHAKHTLVILRDDAERRGKGVKAVSFRYTLAIVEKHYLVRAERKYFFPVVVDKQKD